MQQQRDSWLWYAGAASVHLLTASGVVIGFCIILAGIQRNVPLALSLGLLAMIIDGVDGTLARFFRVKERMPWFDGALLDNIVDYLTYVFAPMVLLWSLKLLPPGPFGILVAALPLLAATYQFCRTDAKTDDHFFLGFPSYWNIIAFYAIVLRLHPTTVSGILIICAILSFVPMLYIYPSRTTVLRRLNMTLASIWLLLYGLIVLQLPAPHPLLINLSLIYVFYYALASLFLTGRRWFRPIAAAPSEQG